MKLVSLAGELFIAAVICGGGLMMAMIGRE